MILHNISKAMREQNYYAVALEFVIVIAGVVVGFQIQAWAEGRSETEREALLLARLDSDFADLSSRAAEAIEQCEMGERNAIRLSSLLAEAPSRDRTALLQALSGAIGTPVPVGRSATYVELLASGEMALIRSEPLRAAMVDFDEQVRRHELAYASLSQLVTGNAAALLETAVLVSSPAAARLEDDIVDALEGHDLAIASQLMVLVNARNCTWFRGVRERADAVLLELAPAG
jgi:hypothetical protein